MLVGFQGCGHGPQCRTCLALAALGAELRLGRQFPVVMEQEPGLQQLGDLSGDQLFGVAVNVLNVPHYVAAKRTNPATRPHFVHGFAPPGCGRLPSQQLWPPSSKHSLQHMPGSGRST